MKIIDPHIDIASIYDGFHLSIDDFFSERNDIPVSLQMLKAADIRIAGFSLFMDPNLIKTNMFDGVNQYYEFYKNLLCKSDSFNNIRNTNDLASLQGNKIGFFYSVEGLECFRSLEDFDYYYELGVRSFGLTWADSNEYATGSYGDSSRGITAKGIQLLKKMSQKRLIVDTAHLNDQSFKDLNKNFDGIIVNTHANAKSIHNALHSLSDDQIQMIVDHEGTVCLLPIKDETGGQGEFEDLYKHLDYIASKWGIERVGLCSDIFPLPEYPFVNDAQNVLVVKDFQSFLLTKMSAEDVAKVSYGNFYNVLSKAL